MTSHLASYSGGNRILDDGTGRTGGGTLQRNSGFTTFPTFGVNSRHGRVSHNSNGVCPVILLRFTVPGRVAGLIIFAQCADVNALRWQPNIPGWNRANSGTRLHTEQTARHRRDPAATVRADIALELADSELLLDSGGGVMTECPTVYWRARAAQFIVFAVVSAPRTPQCGTAESTSRRRRAESSIANPMTAG